MPKSILARTPRWSLGLLLAAGVAGAMWAMPGRSAERATVIPPPAVDAATSADETQTVVLAGGCFWGVQAVFQHVKGVTNAVSGYAGGTKATARYNVVSSGTTSHAESVQVTFDPRQISYGRILQIYFSVAHNPTELNRQGPDDGPQYRSAIFFANPEQQRVAQDYIAQLDKTGTFGQPIVTQLTKYEAFYTAEAYHQDYATLHPESPYIYYNDLPKVENLKKLFPEVYREQPVLVRTAAKS
jgi:peptide-methionine (S)-S-oxide reductase